MKRLNIILLIVLVLMAGFAGWFMIGGTLRAQTYTATAPASEHPDACASIQNIVASGAASQQFDAFPTSTDGCTLVDTTITLTNIGLFDAEWIDISVTPASGDIAVYSITGEASSLAAGTSGQVNLKILTSAPAETVRKITLNYYVYGMPRSITVEG